MVDFKYQCLWLGKAVGVATVWQTCRRPVWSQRCCWAAPVEGPVGRPPQRWSWNQTARLQWNTEQQADAVFVIQFDLWFLYGQKFVYCPWIQWSVESQCNNSDLVFLPLYRSNGVCGPQLAVIMHLGKSNVNKSGSWRRRIQDGSKFDINRSLFHSCPVGHFKYLHCGLCQKLFWGLWDFFFVCFAAVLQIASGNNWRNTILPGQYLVVIIHAWGER